VTAAMNLPPANLPPAIAHYLISLSTHQRDLAYLNISPTGTILSSGGALTHYGLEAASVGESIEQHLLFLSGFFPHPPKNEAMPYVQTEKGKVIDVHFTAYSGEQWILLLNASAQLKQQQHFQQITNDLALLRQRLTKQINQSQHRLQEIVTSETGANETEAANAETPQNKTVERSRTTRKVSVLTIKVNQSPFDLTKLNDYFADIVQLILEESGLIHHIFGSTAVALFGLVPTAQSSTTQSSTTQSSTTQSSTTQSSATQAARVAKQLLRRFSSPLSSHIATAAADSPHYKIGMSIATGDTAVGSIGHSTLKALNVQGTAVSDSFIMHSRISPHSIVVDAPTLQACNTELDAFSRHRLHSGQPITLYQLIPK